MPPSIATIQRVTANHFGVTVMDLLSHRRGNAIVRPRQIAVYLSKQLTSNSLPAIGHKFGNRDHTAVMHALSQIAKLRLTNADLNSDVIEIEAKVSALSRAALNDALIGWAA
jgi:chromosomal replication initiator protein